MAAADENGAHLTSRSRWTAFILIAVSHDVDPFARYRCLLQGGSLFGGALCQRLARRRDLGRSACNLFGPFAELRDHTPDW
jgi:hypothetical protein